jgi:hypothetical protein
MTTHTKKSQKEETGKMNEFLAETKENIDAGARIVEDEARELGEKITSYSEVLFGKIKEYTEEILNSGASLTKDAVNRAQEQAERLRDRLEIRKLNDQKKEVATKLGMGFYLEVKNNENKVPPTLLRRKKFKSLFKELEDLDSQILELSEEK